MTKKLAHAVRQREHDRRGRMPSIGSLHDSFDGDRRCGVCLDQLLDRHHGSDGRRRCAICRHDVCANCSIRKEVESPPHLLNASIGLSRNGRAVARCFCKHCVAKVERDDATMYAVRDASRAERASHVEQEHAHQHRSHQYHYHEHHTVAHSSGRSSVRWGHDEIDDEFPSVDDVRQHSITLFAPDECTFEVDEQRMIPSRHRRNTIAGIAVSGPPIPLTSRQASVPQLSVVPPPPSSIEEVEDDAVEVSTPSTITGNLIGMAWTSRGRSATAPHVPSATAPAAQTSEDDEDGSLAQRQLLRTQSLYATNAPPILLRSDVGKRNWRSSMSALSLGSSHSTGSDGSGGILIPAPARSHHRHRRHRHHRLSGSSHSSRSARCSSFSSNSSSSSTVLVSLSSRGLPPKKRVDFRGAAPALSAALARPQTQRSASHT